MPATALQQMQEMISKKPLDNGPRMIVELSLVNSIEASVDLSKFVVHLTAFIVCVYDILPIHR